MSDVLHSRQGLLLTVLLLAGVELIALQVLRDLGFLQQLLEQDRSQVSLLILVIYGLASLWFVADGFRVSRLFDALWQPADEGRDPLLGRFRRQLAEAEAPEQRDALLQVLETRLRGRYAFGFIVADLMLKLGILGTVIGFILMLGSLTDLNSVDITVMQTLLAEMSAGMKVALYTTLTGLIAGILLNFKFNALDWAVDHLINDLREQMQTA
jgi:biopolymer transport protein ExbB/TolQ